MKENILSKFEKLLSEIGGISLAAIMIVTVLSVFGRYVFRMDLIPGVYNIIERVLFPLLVFLALPRSYIEGSFPKLEILTGRLSVNKRKIVNIIVLIIELAVYCLVTWYVAKFFFGVLERGQQIQVGVVRYPLYPIMFIVLLSFFLLTVEFALSLYRGIKEWKFPAIDARREQNN